MSTSNLSPAEIALLSSVSYSLVEEIDLFYASQHLKTHFTTLDDLKDNLLSAVESMENMRNEDIALWTIYVLSMGNYTMNGEAKVSLRDNRTRANKVLNEISTIGFLCHNLSARMAMLPELVNPERGHTIQE